MTPKVAQFLLDLLDKIQISAADPDFDNIVALIQQARHELRQQKDDT